MLGLGNQMTEGVCLVYPLPSELSVWTWVINSKKMRPSHKRKKKVTPRSAPPPRHHVPLGGGWGAHRLRQKKTKAWCSWHCHAVHPSALIETAANKAMSAFAAHFTPSQQT